MEWSSSWRLGTVALALFCSSQGPVWASFSTSISPAQRIFCMRLVTMTTLKNCQSLPLTQTSLFCKLHVPEVLFSRSLLVVILDISFIPSPWPPMDSSIYSWASSASSLPSGVPSPWFLDVRSYSTASETLARMELRIRGGDVYYA